MAWATVQGVRELTRNLQIDDARIQAAIRMAQSHVRAHLSRLYPTLNCFTPFWWRRRLIFCWARFGRGNESVSTAGSRGAE